MWLDLSFNKIRKIEGLSNNTKIVDLSLANNEIERIENLDGLTELQTLSLSNNKLTVINDVFYLRFEFHPVFFTFFNLGRFVSLLSVR